MAKTLQSLIDSLVTVTAPPVPVDAIAQKLDIQIVYDRFDENPDLSGMLVRDASKNLMIINARHAPPRQRFTIAHEIGHFLLDDFKPVWVDHVVGLTQQVRFRNTNNAAYTQEEVRANKFAAELLMPRTWIAQAFDALNAKGVDWDDEGVIQQLAKQYNVSYQAMLIRLIELGLLARSRRL